MLQSETPSVTTDPQTPSQQSSNADNIQKEQPEKKVVDLAELFKEPEENADDSSAADGKTPVDNIDALVKRLKLTPEQVYNIKVPMRDNAEPLTIGALKDRVGELVGLDHRELEFDQRRIKQEGELLRAQNEMREILAMLPADAIKPALVEKLRNQRQAILDREHNATMEHIPEWQEEKKRTADIKGMIEHLSEYGFPESFLQTITDHRALKYIRDNYLRDKRIKEALAKVKTPMQQIGKRPSAKPSIGAKKPDNRSASTRRSGAPDNRARIMDYLNASEK